MFETETTEAEYGRRRRWRRQCPDESEYGLYPEAESGWGGEAEYGAYGEAEAGWGGEAESGWGEAEYGGYGEAGSGWGGEAEYGPYGEAEYGPSGEGEYGPYGEAEDEAFGEAESAWGGEAESEEGEEQFLPALIPVVGKVLGGLLGGLGREAESGYAGEYSGESELQGGGEAEEQFLGKIFKKVLGMEAEYTGSPLSPAQEAQFAGRLLEVTGEAETDELLSRIVNTVGRAAQGIANAANSPQGRALIEAMKPVVRTALPAVGGAIAPGVGAHLGRAAGSVLETEFSQSEEEQEYEAARRLVRLTTAAAQQAASAPQGAPPELVGEFAVFRAARSLARPLFRHALRRVSPFARRYYGRRYYGRGRSYPRGRYGYGGYRGYGYRRGPRYYGRYRGSGYAPGFAGYAPPAEPPPAEPAAEPPPPQPGYRWVAVPIGAPAPVPPPLPPGPPPPSPPEPGPGGPGPAADSPPPNGAAPAQSEYGGPGFGSPYPRMAGAPTGRWVRRGGQIIILDA